MTQLAPAQGLDPQTREMIEQLIGTGSVNPTMPLPQRKPQPPPMPGMGGYAAAVQGIQGARPTGGMVPIQPDPTGGTGAEQRIGLNADDLANAQFPRHELMQIMMEQQMQAGGDPLAYADRMTPDRGRIAPGMQNAPGPQTPLATPNPQRRTLAQILAGQG